jgi:hypothetical protein
LRKVLILDELGWNFTCKVFKVNTLPIKYLLSNACGTGCGGLVARRAWFSALFVNYGKFENASDEGFSLAGKALG